MIEWEVIRIASYLGLIVGAPAFFLYLVDQNKQKDLSEAASHFYKRAEKENEAYCEKLTKQFNKKLSEKDTLLSQKEAELEKIRPLMKYLRQPPTT